LNSPSQFANYNKHTFKKENTMWSVTRENLDKTRKVNVNFTIDKNLYEQFKRVAQKDMRKYSNIVEGSIRRYVQSKS
jgi:hypothetical protein